MASDDIDIDTMEQILIRSDVKDLVRWKGVCKSWYSFISTPYFTDSHSKQHANYNNNNNDTERIAGSDSSRLIENRLVVVGSANGLVCVSPKGLQLVVVNPCTTQTIKILQTPPEPLPESDRRWDLVWGFGYDPSNNDFKILLGLVKKRRTTRFYVLSLKTCIWKFIQEVDYVKSWSDSVSGILFDGALHWLMMNHETKDLAILSFNLSREEFTKPRLLPDGHSAKRDRHTSYTLGVMKESLHLYECKSGLSTKIWVLRNHKISRKQSWIKVALIRKDFLALHTDPSVPRIDSSAARYSSPYPEYRLSSHATALKTEERSPLNLHVLPGSSTTAPYTVYLVKSDLPPTYGNMEERSPNPSRQ
uniref:F-box/kelch-repeat protein At3g23880-like n=1 Tax=Erigeron canadensis TaxID=72917 RepID=UPI001CB88DB7|nr:F-box/kelch-repeat protein At3g23880-like [Erigeron canadensis]